MDISQLSNLTQNYQGMNPGMSQGLNQGMGQGLNSGMPQSNNQSPATNPGDKPPLSAEEKRDLDMAESMKYDNILTTIIEGIAVAFLKLMGFAFAGFNRMANNIETDFNRKRAFYTAAGVVLFIIAVIIVFIYILSIINKYIRCGYLRMVDAHTKIGKSDADGGFLYGKYIVDYEKTEVDGILNGAEYKTTKNNSSLLFSMIYYILYPLRYIPEVGVNFYYTILKVWSLILQVLYFAIGTVMFVTGQASSPLSYMVCYINQ